MGAAELEAWLESEESRRVGFIRRHRARRPDNEVASRWRYSLMNRGHDPMKDRNA